MGTTDETREDRKTEGDLHTQAVRALYQALIAEGRRHAELPGEGKSAAADLAAALESLARIGDAGAGNGGTTRLPLGSDPFTAASATQ